MPYWNVLNGNLNNIIYLGRHFQKEAGRKERIEKRFCYFFGTDRLRLKIRFLWKGNYAIHEQRYQAIRYGHYHYESLWSNLLVSLRKTDVNGKHKRETDKTFARLNIFLFCVQSFFLDYFFKIRTNWKSWFRDFKTSPIFNYWRLDN